MGETQSWGAVFKAEFKRILMHKSTIIALILFVVAAVALTVLAFVAISAATEAVNNSGQASEELAPILFTGYGLAETILVFTIGLLCATSTARDFVDGAASSTLVLVPKRSRLITARIVIWLLVALVATAVSIAAITLLLANKITDPAPLDMSALGTLLNVLVFTIIGFAGAVLLRKGAYAVLAFLGIEMILPTVLTSASIFMPESFSKIFDAISKALPGAAISNLQTALNPLDSTQVAINIAIIAAWFVASILVANFSFKAYAGSDE